MAHRVIHTSADLAPPEPVREVKHVIGHRSRPSRLAGLLPGFTALAGQNDSTGPAGAWHHPPGQCSLARSTGAAAAKPPRRVARIRP